MKVRGWFVGMKSVDVVFFDIGDTLVNGREWKSGAKDVLAILDQQGVRLGVISNTGGLKRDELAPYLPPDFEFAIFEDALVVLSGEVGVEKPDLRAYLTALTAAGIEPSRCCFVGERMDEIFAAQCAGMRAIRLADSGPDFAALPDLF